MDGLSPIVDLPVHVHHKRQNENHPVLGSDTHPSQPHTCETTSRQVEAAAVTTNKKPGNT